MLPLDGIKVVEVASNIAGPYAGLILGTLGADVLKVERPEGDDARKWGPPFIGDTASIFHTVNLNKRSVTLDLKDPAQAAWLKGYIADADVLVQNMRPGTMQALGLGSAAMLELNPRLVYGSAAAFGAKGPMRLAAGYEPMVQAFAGVFSVNGEAERPGVRVGVSLLDVGTGMWTALGCIAGLLQRERTGKAWWSMLLCSKPRSAGSPDTSPAFAPAAICRCATPPAATASSCSRRSTRRTGRSSSRPPTTACSPSSRASSGIPNGRATSASAPIPIASRTGTC